MQEEWRPVVGYEGYYEVSNHGKVRTVEHQANYKNIKTRTIPSRIRKHCFLKSYPAVNLSKKNKVKTHTVHVMILEAFVGPRPSPIHEGCHNDGNPKNCRLDNLRWDTKVANKQDSFIHGTAVFGTRVGNCKLTEEQMRSIRIDTRPGPQIAAEYGINRSTVNRIRRGATWKRVP